MEQVGGHASPPRQAPAALTLAPHNTKRKPAQATRPELAPDRPTPSLAASPRPPEAKRLEPAAPADTLPQAPARPEPPDAFEPPFAATTSPGDGQWFPWPSSDGPFFRARVHPGKFSRFKEVLVVAIDVRHFSIKWQIGSADLGAEGFLSAGRVPPEELQAVQLLFNGGFLARHGRWGISTGGVEIQPQRPHGCTIALFESVPPVIGTYQRLVAEGDLSHATTLRQTPPCLLENGTLAPQLLRGDDRPWAGKNEERRTRRRSALGISAGSRHLIYGLGIEADAVDLARGMAAAGAVTAAQLDINWYWTRVASVSHDPQSPKLIPLREEMELRPTEYLKTASRRDFFYVVPSSHRPSTQAAP